MFAAQQYCRVTAQTFQYAAHRFNFGVIGQHRSVCAFRLPLAQAEMKEQPVGVVDTLPMPAEIRGAGSFGFAARAVAFSH